MFREEFQKKWQMPDDFFSDVEIHLKIMLCALVCVIGYDLQYNERKSIVMRDFCYRGSLHIDELTSFSLQ